MYLGQRRAKFPRRDIPAFPVRTRRGATFPHWGRRRNTPTAADRRHSISYWLAYLRTSPPTVRVGFGAAHERQRNAPRQKRLEGRRLRRFFALGSYSCLGEAELERPNGGAQPRAWRRASGDKTVGCSEMLGRTCEARPGRNDLRIRVYFEHQLFAPELHVLN